jgi:DNA-binding transcriptional MerR regulator
MFKIREFAHLTKVSVKMLRHYDQLGLLKPARVDPATGYRYYSADQMPRLHRIIALKDLGLSLEQTAALVDESLSPDELRGVLKLHRTLLERRVDEVRQQLAQVDAHLAHLEQGSRLPEFDVIVRPVPALQVATLRSWVFEDGAITNLFEELEAHIARHRARAQASPLTLYHDDDPSPAIEGESPTEGFEVEVAVPISRPLPATERIHIRLLPAEANMACLVYQGSYDRGPAGWAALSAWIEHHGLVLTGPLREVYLRFGAHDPQALGLPDSYVAADSLEYVTELQAPVGPAPGST